MEIGGEFCLIKNVVLKSEGGKGYWFNELELLKEFSDRCFSLIICFFILERNKLILISIGDKRLS